MWNLQLIIKRKNVKICSKTLLTVLLRIQRNLNGWYFMVKDNKTYYFTSLFWLRCTYNETTYTIEWNCRHNCQCQFNEQNISKISILNIARKNRMRHLTAKQYCLRMLTRCIVYNNSSIRKTSVVIYVTNYACFRTNRVNWRKMHHYLDNDLWVSMTINSVEVLL